MTAGLASERAAARPWPAVLSLGAIEAKRFARHPLFLSGLALAGLVVAVSVGKRSLDVMDYGIVASFFVGVVGFVVAIRLARSTSGSQDLLDGTPLDDAGRTAALCLACLVPLGAGIVVATATWAAVVTGDNPDWYFGTFGPRDRFLILWAMPVVRCLGGPLLGLAVGRWLRFPGSAILATLGLVAGCNLLSSLSIRELDPSSFLARTLHLLPPYTSFTVITAPDYDDVHAITSGPGSPAWYLVWIMLLTVLAGIAALARGSQGRRRRRLATYAVAATALAVAALILSVATGPDRPHDRLDDGRTVVTPASAL